MASHAAAAFHSHDHAPCAASVIAAAEARIAEAGLRLTPVRRRTLEILLEEHRAMGAYDVLERLADEGFGNQPPVAYRALEFLVEHGLAHRIRRLNAFAACMQPRKAHAPVFFVCDSCKAVAETALPDLRDQIVGIGADMGFAVERLNVEAGGTCPGCQEKATA